MTVFVTAYTTHWGIQMFQWDTNLFLMSAKWSKKCREVGEERQTLQSRAYFNRKTLTYNLLRKYYKWSQMILNISWAGFNPAFIYTH